LAFDNPYSVDTFKKDGYVKYPEEFTKIITNRIDYAVQQEGKEREAPVNKVLTDTARGFSHKNFKAALANF
jgi:hypothetical protein